MYSRLLVAFVVLNVLLLVHGFNSYHVPPGLDTTEVSPGIEALQDKLRPLNILMAAAYFPGHLFPLMGLGETLVKRGHNVTLCTTVMQGSKILPKLAERVGVKFVSAGYDTMSQQDYENLIREFAVNTINMELLTRYMGAIPPTNVQVKDQMELMGISQYDIIIVDMNTLPIAVYFSKLGIKTILFTSYLAPLTALIPQWTVPLAPLDQTDDLSFLERLFNAVLQPIFLLKFRTSFEGVCALDKNFSVVLGNDNLITYPGMRFPLIVTSVLGFDFPKTIGPLAHYVGPVLMSSSPDLDPTLSEWLNVRENRSVIYISMGTTGYITSDMAQSLVQGVMATKYDAVWSLRMSNRDILKDIDIDPNRFYLAEWVSQQMVLKHPSISLTILHCGMNGVQESLYNALPIVCLPYSFDHYEMSAKIQTAGVGVSLYTYFQSLFVGKSFSPESMSQAIKSVDTTYMREQAQRLQLMFYFSGGSHRAAELVEFYEMVDYSHLAPAYVKYNWSWVQYYNLDVYCVLSVVSCLLLFLVYQVAKSLARCFSIDYKSKLD